jgi:hypothetical protein
MRHGRGALILGMIVLGLSMLGLYKNAHIRSADLEKAAKSVELTAPSAGTTRLPSSVPAARDITTVGDTEHMTHLKSLGALTKTLEELARPNIALEQVIHDLENNHQEPAVIHDANSTTGDMAIVRTNAPPAGTRYFHVQHFADGAGGGFVQHASFEYKAGPTAMTDTVAAVRENFHGLGKPEQKGLDFIKWNLDDGHVLWVKRMGLADLQENPYNAYQPSDVGTIRVAIEVDAHEGESEK